MHQTNGLRILALLLIFALAQSALAQFQWQDNGIAVRQGAHLGWNGAAVAAGNDVALFYYDCLRDGTRDVWGTRIAPNGDHIWGENGRLIAGDISEQRAPVVAAYADGSVLAVWEDYSVGRFRDLKAQRYDQSGNAMWSPSEGVDVIESYRDQFDVKLALNDEGYAFIVFTDDRLTQGAETRLNVFAQVLTPGGSPVGPLDGYQLLFQRDYYNQALDVVCIGSDAYVLCKSPGVPNNLVIQKILPDGTLGFADENGVVEYSEVGNHTFAAIDSGLALGWTMRDGNGQFGDAYLTLLNTDRTPLSGWTADGIEIQPGSYTQSITKLTEAPGGGVIAALADYEFDPDNATLSLYHYSRTGQLVWGPVEFGNAALRTSPLDWYWNGSDLVVTWMDIVNYTDYRVHTQKLNSNGVKQWGENGNIVWTRENKKLRADIEKPANATARLVIVSGRSIAQPESLFVAELNSGGQISGNAEFLSGGWTYDSYDQRIAKIDEQKLAVIWSDSRSSLERDVYFQLVDGNGTALLEPNGRQLSSGENLSIYLPPAIAADGNGGAYLGWVGDSVGATNIMRVHHIDGYGTELWSEPVAMRSPNGFYGQSYLIPDGNGGTFVAFARFNSSFVARICVAHINASGSLSWGEGFYEFPGQAGSDMPLTSAFSDGHGGCYLSGMTGPWQDTQAIILHINSDGTFGDGWTDSGREYGGLMTRDRNSKAILVGNNVLLTYEQPQSEAAATYDVRAALITLDGTNLWGAQGRRLSPAGSAVIRHKLSSDGQGGFLLAYEDFRSGSSTHAYLARFDGNGTAAWSNTERLVCSYDGDQSSLTMTHDGNGGAWLMWEDYRNTDIYTEIDLYGTHIDGNGDYASIGGFTWPAEGYPVCDVPTYQQEPELIPWAGGSALASWKDLRSSNPGRCCGAGAVGDIFNNIYIQVLTEVALGAEDIAEVVPSTFTLSAYPNPFNPSTTLSFSLPQNASVKLTIFNLLGQATDVVYDAPLLAGDYAFNWDASNLPSGLYFAKLETSTGLSTIQKLTLLK